MSAHHKQSTLAGSQKCEAGTDQAVSRATRALALVDDLETMLRRVGPCDLEDLRERLCVASQARFRAAVRKLVWLGRGKQEGKLLRLISTDGSQSSKELPMWYRKRVAVT